jgi:hypothetical protein
MRERRLAAASLAASLLLLGACSAEREGQTAPLPTGDPTAPSEATAPPSTPSTTEPAPTTATTTLPTTGTTVTTTTEPSKRTTTTTTTSPAKRTTTTTTTTSTLPPVRGAHNPKCVVRLRPGDSLSLIADAVDNRAVTVASLQRENGIADPNQINAGDLLDICVRNKIDDVSGDRRVPTEERPTSPGGPITSDGVEGQQQKLNQLFSGLGFPSLAVDGDSGPYTEQALCAARLALNLPVGRSDMEVGGTEEQALMAATGISIPPGAPTWASRWVLIDQTCQVMFVGEGSSRIVFVFPTSTGESGHETRPQDGSTVFRYDPALDNDGWHNSSIYPVEADNPLNGNMYKPLYFDNGQAIHGANNVPPSPASKGCARLPVSSQDALIGWLGLGDVTEPTYDEGRIGLVVSVQGSYL